MRIYFLSLRKGNFSYCLYRCNVPCDFRKNISDSMIIVLLDNYNDVHVRSIT